MTVPRPLAFRATRLLIAAGYGGKALRATYFLADRNKRRDSLEPRQSYRGNKNTDKEGKMRGFWVVLGMTGFVVAAVVGNAIRRIPESPPHVVLVGKTRFVQGDGPTL